MCPDLYSYLYYTIPLTDITVIIIIIASLYVYVVRSTVEFTVARPLVGVAVRWSSDDLVGQETLRSVCPRLRTRWILPLHLRAIQRRMYFFEDSLTRWHQQ